MKRSTDRILTTHTGSLPRSRGLLDLVFAKEDGKPVDEAAYQQAVRDEVAAIVRQQAEVGVDVLNDGEVSKIGYSTYVKDRLTGFEGESAMPQALDFVEFPEWTARMFAGMSETMEHMRTPACTGPIAVKDRELLRTDIENLKAAAEGVQAEEVFMSAASPGVIALFFPNEHYRTRQEYVEAIGAAMQEEYEAIANAGFVLQLDCPDLAMGRHIQFGDREQGDFLKEIQLNVDVLNEATRNIDPERMRLHLCWGNYEGPHIFDIPLREIVDTVLRARPNGISLEACNPRHEHEWKLWEEVELPDEKVLIPGVIDSTTNYVEHPEAIAQRLERYARAVGIERVMAGSDCGFGTFAGMPIVDPKITWRKFQAMREGADLAAKALRAPARA